MTIGVLGPRGCGKSTFIAAQKYYYDEENFNEAFTVAEYRAQNNDTLVVCASPGSFVSSFEEYSVLVR